MSSEASRGSEAGGSNAIPITSLSVPDLQGLREKVDVEVQRLQSSKFQLQRVLNAFQSSDVAIRRLSESQQGDEILLPLTESLYVTGRIASTEKVVVDVGTGYYVERTVNEAVDYCKRKAAYLTENIKQVGQALMEQQKALNMISHVLQDKVQQQQSSEAMPS